MNPLDQIAQWLTSQGFDLGPGGIGGLLKGITGSANPLVDIMALAEFINQAQIGQEQQGLMTDVIGNQKSALNTAMDPAKLSAWIKALTPKGWSPDKYAQVSNQLTNKLSQPFIENTLNPVNAELAAEGRNTSPTTSQYVSEQALAPYNIQEQQMGQSGAQSLMQQLLSLLGMGESNAEFSLRTPNETPYNIPNFGFMDPGGSGGFNVGGSGGFNLNNFSTTGSGFNPTALGILQNQFLPGVS